MRITWGHWFALFNIVLALLISSRFAFSADWPNTLAGKLYFFVSLFGHFSFIVFAFFLLLLFPLAFVIQNDRAYRGIAVMIATVGMTVLLLDTEVFHRFYLHLSPLVWDLLVNPEHGELARGWQLFFVPMPLILLAEMLYSRWCWQKLRSFNRQTWGKYVALFFLGCFIATHLIYAWADMTLYRPITAQRANYPLAYPMTARSFLEKHGLIDREEFQQQLEEKGKPDSFYVKYPKQALTTEKRAPVNVMLINLSGLDNHAISQKNMPFLSQISHQSMRFWQHYNSGDSESAGILGLFYSLSGKYVDSVLGGETASPWIELMRTQGYRFGLFSHNGFQLPLYRRALFRDFPLSAANHNLMAMDQWKRWFKAQDLQQPFFSYLDLTLPSAKDLATQTKLLDWQFSEIWKQLDERRVLGKTVVVINANRVKYAASSVKAQAFERLPLMIYWQGQNREYHGLTSQLDIMPTLMRQFFGVSNPTADYAMGVDLTTVSAQRWVLGGNRRRDVAILHDGDQYHIDKKGHFESFNAKGEPENNERPPLALFLQLIQHSNRFMEK